MDIFLSLLAMVPALLLGWVAFRVIPILKYKNEQANVMAERIEILETALKTTNDRVKLFTHAYVKAEADGSDAMVLPFNQHLLNLNYELHATNSAILKEPTYRPSWFIGKLPEKQTT